MAPGRRATRARAVERASRLASELLPRQSMIAPTFATAPRRATRRLLLVSYHFPPDTAVGGLRWQKLARYAAERGWGLDVMTLDPADLSNRDVERLEDLPGGVRVYGVRAARLRIESAADRVWSAIRKLGHRPVAGVDDGRRESRPRVAATAGALEPREMVRAYFAWLDYARGRLWARRAAFRARSVFQAQIHRAIITSGPPHMAHEAGRRLSRATGLPFVVDLRDPWRLVQRLPESIASPLWYVLAAYYERRAVRQAALIVANTEPHERALRALYPQAADRIITVPNGCDDDPLPEAERAGPSGPRRFVVAYAGTIYLDRNPRPLLRAAARVVAAQQLSPDEFGIELMGEVERFDGVSVMQIAREEGIEAYVRLHPHGTRRDALHFLSQAQLLVILPQDSDLAIPAKMFDYMRCDAWVLALARRDCAVELLLRGSTADVVAPDDVHQIADRLGARVAQHRCGVRPERLSRDPRYGRRAMADRLFDAIDALPCAAS